MIFTFLIQLTLVFSQPKELDNDTPKYKIIICKYQITVIDYMPPTTGGFRRKYSAYSTTGSIALKTIDGYLSTGKSMKFRPIHYYDLAVKDVSMKS